MAILIGFVIVFSTIGLVLNYRSSIRAQRNSFTRQTGYFSSFLSNALLVCYLLGGLILIVGFSVVPRTYYDYLSLHFLVMTLGMLLICVLFGGLLGETIKPVIFLHFRNHKERVFLAPLSLFIFFAFILLMLFTTLIATDSGKGLVNGPQWATGIVEGKYTSSSRSGTSYYIKINGKHRETPDSEWWHSINKGDEIQYVFNPYATVFIDAYRPDRTALTTPGKILIFLGLLYWFLIINLAKDGFTKSWKEVKRGDKVYLANQQKKELASLQAYEPEMVEYEVPPTLTCFTLLLIGFSIMTGIFFIIRRLGQKRETK